jgi:phosphatidylglycerophosphate synthase
VRLAPQHLLSFSRVLMGAVVYAELSHASSSWLVLPAIAWACAADWLDGRVARHRGEASMAGRLLDNLCDAGFLALAFAGFALATTWSLPLVGSATRYWEHANWLPLITLAASFGTYLVRWAVSASRRLPLLPSVRGHTAGVANYVLAVVGGVAVLPGVELTPWILEPTFVTVALLNATAATDNVRLLVVPHLG